MPGVLLGIKRVADRPGVTVGLDALLGVVSSADAGVRPPADRRRCRQRQTVEVPNLRASSSLMPFTP